MHTTLYHWWRRYGEWVGTHFLHQHQTQTLTVRLNGIFLKEVKTLFRRIFCVCVCFNLHEWVLWQQVMVFTLNVFIFKNRIAKIKEKRKHRRYVCEWACACTDEYVSMEVLFHYKFNISDGTLCRTLTSKYGERENFPEYCSRIYGYKSCGQRTHHKGKAIVFTLHDTETAKEKDKMGCLQFCGGVHTAQRQILTLIPIWFCVNLLGSMSVSVSVSVSVLGSANAP